MTVKMNFRTDGWHWADLKNHGWTTEQFRGKDWYSAESIAEFDATPPAKPGDVWRIHWRKEDSEGNPIDGPIAGYAICCPKCLHVHCWTTANNCNQPVTLKYTDDKGEHEYKSCVHSGKGSCWEWTGSAEDNTLSAHPSLLVTQDCRYHGYLTNGELKEC